MSAEVQQSPLADWHDVRYGKDRHMGIYIPTHFPEGAAPIGVGGDFGLSRNGIARVIERWPHLPLVGFDVPFTHLSKRGIERTAREAPVAGMRYTNKHLGRAPETPMDMHGFSIFGGILAYSAFAYPTAYGNLTLYGPAGTTRDHLLYQDELTRLRLRPNGQPIPERGPKPGDPLALALARNARQARKDPLYQSQNGKANIRSDGMTAMMEFVATENIGFLLKRRQDLQLGYMTRVILTMNDAVFPIGPASDTLDRFGIGHEDVPGPHPSLAIPAGMLLLKQTVEAGLDQATAPS